MSEKLSASDNPANREHLCAKQVVHEKWGKGDCIPTMHAEATEDGHVAWYDVMFEHGIETRVAVEDLEITLAESHSHSGKKMKKEAVETETCEECGEEYEKGTKHECSDDDMKEGKMDPVGQEDGDVDNDGDEDESDKYLKMRRKAISKALSKKK
jgi:cobalamin biosynthesis protein CobT